MFTDIAKSCERLPCFTKLKLHKVIIKTYLIYLQLTYKVTHLHGETKTTTKK